METATTTLATTKHPDALTALLKRSNVVISENIMRLSDRAISVSAADNILKLVYLDCPMLDAALADPGNRFLSPSALWDLVTLVMDDERYLEFLEEPLGMIFHVSGGTQKGIAISEEVKLAVNFRISDEGKGSEKVYRIQSFPFNGSPWEQGHYFYQG